MGEYCILSIRLAKHYNSISGKRMGTLHQLQDQTWYYGVHLSIFLVIFPLCVLLLWSQPKFTWIHAYSYSLHDNPSIAQVTCNENIRWSIGIIRIWRKTLFGTVGPSTYVQYLFSLHRRHSTLSWYSYLYKMQSFLHEWICLYSIPNSTNIWCASLQVDGNTFSSGNIFVFSAL